MRPTGFFIAVAIIALGCLVACNSNESTSTKTATTASGQQAPAAYADGVRRVTVAELKGLLAKNEAVVIDVRNQSSFDMAHIRGAKLIPEAEVKDHVDELPRNKLIVTYCS